MSHGKPRAPKSTPNTLKPAPAIPQPQAKRNLLRARFSSLEYQAIMLLGGIIRSDPAMGIVLPIFLFE